MARTPLPRPPRAQRDGNVDPFEVVRWYDALWLALSKAASIGWDIIDFTGSSLGDLEDRRHELLQDIEAADVDSTNTDPGKHITNLLGYGWKRNLTITRSVAADATAVIGEHLSVTCSTVDITVSLPDVAANNGYPVWVHKVDATAFKVLVPAAKDIKFQGSTMHLISNGTTWVIS
jgi:hypothetical protein